MKRTICRAVSQDLITGHNVPGPLARTPVARPQPARTECARVEADASQGGVIVDTALWHSEAPGRPTGFSAFVVRCPLSSFVLLSFVISWIIWLPTLLSYRGVLAVEPSAWLHYAGACGPIAAALLVEYTCRGRPGVGELLARLGRGRIGLLWWLAALSPFALIPMTSVVLSVGWDEGLAWEGLGVSSKMPGFTPLAAWAFAILTYGIGEETGWRGFLLPRLQHRFNALGATLVLSVVWASWHVPLFFYREGYVGLGAGGALGLIISMALGAVVLTWLFNSTGGSVLAVAVWHGTWNLLAMTDAFAGRPVAIMSSIILAFGVALIFAAGPQHLSRQKRVTVPWPPSPTDRSVPTEVPG